jgi:hypothetical protein
MTTIPSGQDCALYPLIPRFTQPPVAQNGRQGDDQPADGFGQHGQPFAKEERGQVDAAECLADAIEFVIAHRRQAGDDSVLGVQPALKRAPVQQLEGPGARPAIRERCTAGCRRVHPARPNRPPCGRQRDLAAVTAGLSLPWSNGQVEGQINRLKLVKRTMYGRASFDLLRKRVLTPT